MTTLFGQKASIELENTIIGLIVKQYQNCPEKIAIIDGNTRVNYQSLMQRASEFAGELESQGVLPGSLVGVCMNRTWELIAALIGTMQAGCAYIPLDPSYPQGRVRYMLEHSNAVAAIVDDQNAAELCKGVSNLLWIDKVGSFSSNTTRASSKDLAYVIYTSGSTGKPKGVAVEHKNLVAMSQSMGETFDEEDLSGVVAAASVCFDTSVMEIFGTLSLGGTVILAKNALELTKLPALDQVKTCVMVASAMQAILSTEKLPKGLRCLVFGGEALKKSLVKQVQDLNSDLRIFNAYGPTEDTVYSTISEIFPDTDVITIGKSITSSRAYILDDSMKPTKSGKAGELYLAGNKLARGYLHDEALTQERFIEIEPNDLIPDNRLYKSGDLCRWTKTGDIEFLGRVDQQVKVRGFRIELEEIESSLELLEGIEAAAAAAVEGGMEQTLLAVYVVCKNDSVSEAAIKEFLSKRLPKYMVPQIVRYVTALPLLPNDKLDRNKLMNMERSFNTEEAAKDGFIDKLNTASVIQNKTSVTPGATYGADSLIQGLGILKGNQQAVILSVIQGEIASLLKLGNPDNVSPELTFDALGLDSLTTVELEIRLSNILDRRLPMQAIIENNSPNSLADYIFEMISSGEEGSEKKVTTKALSDTLASFQSQIQSSHPTFQAAKVSAWCATDKSKLVQEVMRMVNNNRRNPYSKVLKTGSATKGIVGDAYNDEEQDAIIWTTNLYLGLNRDPKVIEEASSALRSFGTGMGTSAAASGMTNQHLEFETEFAELVGKPSACLFPTGYTANVGAIAGLLGKNDVVVIDQLCHASIVDGARLCGAKIRTFQHNDAEDLAAVLESEASPYNSVLVVLEGVYSMGEGAAPVAKIVRTAKKYDALVLVDEAHSFGFYGKRGAGICAEQGITEDVDFIMTTLSKALGSLGGVVAASKEHVDLLKSSARAYIFQASISPADMAASLTALRRLRSDDSLRERLWDTTRYMRQQFEQAGYDLGTGDGPIVTPHFSDKDKLFGIVQNLYQRGVQTSAVTYPIVEPGRGRLRLICSAAHTKEDVDKTLAALIEAEREVDKQLTTNRGDSIDLTINQSDIELWANGFCEYLQVWISNQLMPIPELAVSIRASDHADPLVMVVKNGTVTVDEVNNNLPTCSITISDYSAISALNESDIQKLLESICQGTCKLNGQVEPFVWLVARLLEHNKVIHTHKTIRTQQLEGELG